MMIEQNKERCIELIDYIRTNGRPLSELYNKDPWYNAVLELKKIIKKS